MLIQRFPVMAYIMASVLLKSTEKRQRMIILSLL
jgi:hypothetical protein